MHRSAVILLAFVPACNGLVRNGAGGVSDTEAVPSDASPTNVEVDLGPEARPSDYPEAKAWRDTAAPDPKKPCCTQIAPVRIDGNTSVFGVAALAWNGDGWGVVWPVDGSLAFHALRRDGSLEGALIEAVTVYPVSGMAMTWGNDRYALAYSGATGSGVRVLNRSGFGPWGDPSLAPYRDRSEVSSVARLTAAHGFVVAVRKSIGGGSAHTIGAYFANDQGTVESAETTFVANTVSRPSLADMKSLVAVVYGDVDGIREKGVTFPNPDPDSPATLVLPFAISEDLRVGTTAYRDTVVVAATNRQAGHVLAGVVDPWSHSVVSGPHVVGSSRLFDYGASLAAASDRGFVGLCYSRGEQGSQSVMFRVLGPDAEPWTAEQTVADGLELAGGCSVGWSGAEFLVAWWEAGLSKNKLSVTRLIPTF